MEDVDFQNSGCGLAGQETSPTFQREDWSLFRTIEGLQQRAGVPKRLRQRLVVKELADNGLDNGTEIEAIVEDDAVGGLSFRMTGPAWMARPKMSPVC